MDSVETVVPSKNGKRGRPAGVKNGQGTTVLAPIKKWTMRDESVVRLHIAGVDNKIIAEHLNITPTRVSQVLRDVRAKELIDTTIKTIRQKSIESVEDGLMDLQVQSVDRLRETIQMEFVPGSDSKKHQDNVALSLVKGVIPVSDANRRVDQPNIPEKLFDRLVSALENSNKAKDFDGVIVEADVELVETH